MSKLIFYLFLFWVCNVATQAEPEIRTITGAQKKKNKEYSVDISCRVRDVSGYNVLWKRTDGKPGSIAELISTNGTINIIPGDRFRVIYNAAFGSFILRISNLELSDAGTYICEVLLDKDHSITKETQLQVVEPEVQPFFHPNSTNAVIEVDENSDFTIECYADGFPKPTIIIARDGGVNLPDGRPNHNGNVLKIEKIQKKDEGKYNCIAFVPGRTTTKHIFITVRVAPVTHS